jgi:hypothetical protein
VNIPPSELIESAVDASFQEPVKDVLGEVSELTEAIAQSTAKRINVQYPLSDDFNIGYALGLTTARLMIETNVAIQQSTIKPEDVL